MITIIISVIALAMIGVLAVQIRTYKQKLSSVESELSHAYFQQVLDKEEILMVRQQLSDANTCLEMALSERTAELEHAYFCLNMVLSEVDS